MRTGRDWLWMAAAAGLAVGAACDSSDDEGGSIPETPTPGAQVSFEQQVHPLLQGKCGTCHGSAWGSSDVSTSYQAALGEVDTANPAQSPLYVRPTGGGGHEKVLSDTEAQLLLRWIQEGAKGPTAAAPVAPAPTTTVSFSQQIHPFLVSSCGGCHGEAWGSSDVAISHAAAVQEVDTANPPQSLLYVRPTGTGHPRILTGTNADLLLLWIQEGARNN